MLKLTPSLPLLSRMGPPHYAEIPYNFVRMSLGVSRKPSTTLGRAAAWERRLALFFFHHSNKIALAVAFSGFLGRAWLAHATFFNPDEAWHYSAANQDSLRHAYQASLALFHPPLL